MNRGVMRSCWISVFLGSMLLGLIGCQGMKDIKDIEKEVNSEQTITLPVDTQEELVLKYSEKMPQVADAMPGKVIGICEGSALIGGTDTKELYLVPIELPIYGAEGQLLKTAVLEEGQLVSVGYSGMTLETYPAQLGGASYIQLLGEEESLISLYLSILEEMYQMDNALNEAIVTIGLDVSQLTNLTSVEQRGLAYLLGYKYGMEVVEGTYEELVTLGYIVEDGAYFNEGVLLTLRVTSAHSNRIVFSAEKWRSGLGAVGCSACIAEKKGGKWIYTLNNMWIA